MRILIADDEQIVRFGLKLVLKNIWPEAETNEAEDLDGVITLLASLTFDLVVLDIHMPGSEGLEQLIKSMHQEKKVVIFSGTDPTNPRIKSLKAAGVHQFIFKTAAIEEIKIALRSLFPDHHHLQ